MLFRTMKFISHGIIVLLFLFQGPKILCAADGPVEEIGNVKNTLLYSGIKASDYLPYSTLNFSFNYTTNLSSFGQVNQLVKQPALTSMVSFFSKHQYDMTISGFFIDNSDEQLEKITTEIDVTAGYNFQPFKNFQLYPSYSRFFYSENSNSIKSSYTDNIQLDISYEPAWYLAGVSANYLIGENNSFFLYIQNGINLSFHDVIFENTFLFIQPEVDLNLGNQTYYSNYFWENVKSREDFRHFLHNNKWFIREFLNMRRKYPNLGDKEIVVLLSSEFLQEEEKFNLNSVSILIPLFYMVNSFSFSISFMGFIPTFQPEYMESGFQYLLDFGITYSLDFKK